MPQSDDADEVLRRYEQKTAALIGRRITGVTYWDIHNHSDVPPTWDFGDWHHAVMGVELTTETDPRSVLWTSTFYPYGVEVFPVPISKHLRQGEGCRLHPCR